MAEAKRDQNQVTTLLAVSLADGVTPVTLYADPATHRLLTSAASSGGDVVGPASATDNAVARFDGTTGKLIQNSVVTISDTGAINGVASITMPTFTVGSVLFAGTGGIIAQDNANFFWDDTNDRLSVGGSSNIGTLNINRSNADFTNTGGAGSHIYMSNPNGSGQNVVSSFINGSMVGKWRSDVVGNINWVSAATSNDRGHYFYVGGDFGSGSVKLKITPTGVVAGSGDVVGNTPAYAMDVQGTLGVTGISTFGAALVPSANDGAPLGTTTRQFSDLFLAEGGVINWDNGDVSITQTGDVLTFAGASTRYEFSNNITPTANDGAALGTTALGFADAFLASGGVVNFANGNYTLTHSSGILSASSDFRIASANVGTNADSVPTLSSTSTLTNKTMTGTNNTLTASLLKSATTEVSVSAATAPSSGQVLTATSSTAATWQTPTAALVMLGETVLGGAAASISVASIATGYRYLRVQMDLVIIGSATAAQYLGVRLNNISTADYGSQTGDAASTAVTAERISDSTSGYITNSANWLETSHNGLFEGTLTMPQTSKLVTAGIYHVSASGVAGLFRYSGSSDSSKFATNINFGLKQTSTFDVTRIDIINSAGNSLLGTGSRLTIYGMA